MSKSYSIEALDQSLPTDPDSITVEIKGSAFRSLKTLAELMVDVNEPGDVVTKALAVLHRAKGKVLTIDYGDGTQETLRLWK
jgi:hypothetical protein